MCLYCNFFRCLESHGKTSDIPVFVDYHSKSNTSKSFVGAFICRLCQEKCVDEEQLQKHFISYHSGRLPFQCSNCNSEFDSELNESKHTCCKINTEEFECVLCSKKLPSYNHLYIHINKEHIQMDSICKVCNKMFPNRDALKEHSLSHKEGKRFTCAFCSKAFSNSQYLTLHMKRHTSSKVLKCKICFRAFLDKNSLFQHMLLHASMPGTDRPFTCCLCSVSFSQRGGLKFHIEQSHIKNHILKKCPVCNEVQDCKSMSNHIIKHCSKISSNKMTKVETDWVKKNQPNFGQETLQHKTKRKVQAELQIKPDRYKRTSNSNSPGTTKQIQGFETKAVEETTNEERKFNVTKSNRLPIKKKSTLSNTKKSTLNEVKSEENSFVEDLNLIKKRLEESSDSEFENDSSFLGFTGKPIKTLDLLADENILDVKEVKKEMSDSPSMDQSEYFNSESSITTEQIEDLLKPVKIEETVTKERPMSFLLVTADDKTASKYTSDNYIRENTKKRGSLEITTNKRAIYRNKLKERSIKTMLSNTIANKKKLRTSNRHNKLTMAKVNVKTVLGKENLSLENISPSSLEGETLNCKTEHEENRSVENNSPSSLEELEENMNCQKEHEENFALENNSPSRLEELDDNMHCQTECEEKLSLENNSPSCLEKLEENRHNQTKREEVSTLPCIDESKPSLDKETKEAEQDSVRNGCIQEKKYFEPSRNLSKFGCSMCMLTFSSQDELFLHNAEHVL